MWFKRNQINRLIKAKLMGTLTAEQEQELNKILEGSKEDQVRFMQLLEIEKQLKESKTADEPINVSPEVMQKIIKRNPMGLKTKAIPAIGPVFFRLAAVLVVGLLLGSAITWMVTSESLTPTTESLAGTLAAPPEEGISYLNQNNLIQMIPYQIGNIYYLNFVLDTRSEIKMEVSFQESNLKMIKANYIASDGSESVNLYSGSINFSATGKTSFQIIFEKLQETSTDLIITAQKDQSVLFTKQISLDK
ncbi:MAG: hypothetical protein KKF98_10450 [Bacteroidetes bacterium]|nr:hypothetical protein [Bacteroidota bacterium]